MTAESSCIRPFELAAALRRFAAGDPALEAAVELVVASRFWSDQRSDFRAAIDVWWPTPGSPDAWAEIDWQRVADTDWAASSGERRILALACEFAGVDTGGPLVDLLSGLDPASLAMIESYMRRIQLHGGLVEC